MKEQIEKQIHSLNKILLRITKSVSSKFLKTFAVFFFIITCLNSNSQTRQIGMAISNNVCASPISGYPLLFYSRLNPGIDFQVAQKINSKQKNQFWCMGEATLFYHRFFQTAVKLNAGISYNYYFKPNFNSILGVEGGYLHSFYRYELFKLNSNGDYVKISGVTGRPQFNAGIYWGVSYGLNKSHPDKFRLYLRFKTFVQGKFAGNYIPLVPYNHVSIGMSYALTPKVK